MGTDGKMKIGELEWDEEGWIISLYFCHTSRMINAGFEIVGYKWSMQEPNSWGMDVVQYRF